jgi:hypothetical protein
VQRTGRVLAVDLGGRCDQDRATRGRGGLEHDLGPADVREQRLERPFDDELDTHRRREVDDHLGLIHQFADRRMIEDRSTNEPEPWIALEMSDVAQGPGRQVVQHHDLVAPSDQSIGEVRTDEPGAAGDEVAHLDLPFGPHHRSGSEPGLGFDETKALSVVGPIGTLKRRRRQQGCEST